MFALGTLRRPVLHVMSVLGVFQEACSTHDVHYELWEEASRYVQCCWHSC